MKFLIVSVFLLITISNIFVESLNKTEIVGKSQNTTNLTLARGINNDRVYLGCFRDLPYQRMFRGYVVGRGDMHIDRCIQSCKGYNFVYAGLQAGFWCFCGDSAPQTQYNERLAENQCSTTCGSTSHQHENCGGVWTMSVYRTGIKVIRKDEYGNYIGESISYSDIPWELKWST